MSPQKLTPKQAKFALAVANGSSLADAYRGAYNVRNMKAETIHGRAHELAKDGKVAGRIKEIQQDTVIASLWDREKSVKTKIIAVQIARDKEDPAGIIRASESLDRQFGLEPARKIDLTSSDGSMTPQATTSITVEIVHVIPKASD